MKRASAAMLAGQKADAALWLQGNGWSSSTAYAPAPEKSLLRFIQANPVEADFGKSWSRMGKASDYKYDDAGLGEKPPPEWDPTFPHLLQPRDGKPTTFFYAAWEESPYSDAYVARMASAAIDGMKLGQGPGTDYLAISFSALDVVGHDFGPRSHEIQDVLMRLDETLGKFLADLDKKVGKDRYVLAFTADHGVAEIPEQAKAEGKDAGRIMMNDIMARTDQTMSAKFGAGHWVAVQAYSELYFRAGVFEKLTGDPELLASVIHGIEAVPGVQRVIDGRTLAAPPAADEDAATQAARKSYFPGRSGDLLIIPKPNWIFVSDDKTIIPGNATTHGTYNDYDQRVPLILFGGGIAKGRYETAVTPADIAPTLARLCGISLPTATGHPLDEALPQSMKRASASASSAFTRRVIAAVRRIPPGRVTTYGDIARLAGKPRAARAVGNIMRGGGAPGLPYHRVIAAAGRLGGYGGNELLKAALLRAEGLVVSRGPRPAVFRRAVALAGPLNIVGPDT